MNAEQSRLTARARVFSRLVIDSSGCLLWTAGKTKCGYGRIMIGGQQSLVHRVMFEWFIGPVPAGMFLDHLCRRPSCANPIHLEPVTHRENVVRGISPVAVNAAAGECVRGHPFDERNTHIRPDGARCCRACGRERSRQNNKRLSPLGKAHLDVVASSLIAREAAERLGVTERTVVRWRAGLRSALTARDLGTPEAR